MDRFFFTFPIFFHFWNLSKNVLLGRRTDSQIEEKWRATYKHANGRCVNQGIVSKFWLLLRCPHHQHHHKKVTGRHNPRYDRRG
jgi:hypothetical protein